MTDEERDYFEGQIEKFDALREVGIDVNARCFLIKSAGNSNYESVIELTGGWYKGWSEYRLQVRISFATLDENFADIQAQASFFAYGVPDADNQIDVYPIEDGERDKVPPDLQKPYWKFYGVRKANERFTILN